VSKGALFLLAQIKGSIMRRALLIINGILLFFISLLAMLWHGLGTADLPVWSSLLQTPITLLILLIILPFVPYRGSRQLLLAAQAFLVGMLLAMSWVGHSSGLDDIVLAYQLLGATFITYNLVIIQRKNPISGIFALMPYIPFSIVIYMIVFVAQHEAIRPIDSFALNRLHDQYKQSLQDGDAKSASENATEIRKLVIAGMVEKGYSVRYSRNIAKNTEIKWLIPLVKRWELVEKSESG